MKPITKNLPALCMGLVLLFLTACQKGKQETVEPEAAVSYVDMVYPLLDSKNSRWFFFSSANRPFGMVNLSPDTETNGAWGSGYRYNTDTIRGFSHIHAWQLSGLSMMPVTIDETNEKSVYTDFDSPFDHDKENVTPGYHYVELDRYGIAVSLTSTPRVGFHKYRYPEVDIEKAVLFNLNTVLGPCENSDGVLSQDGAQALSGSFVMQPTRRRPKPLTAYFKIQSNVPITGITQDPDTQNYRATFDTNDQEVLLKVGLSYTSIDNATENLKQELPHWDFDQVVADSKTEWNGLLSRIQVEGGTETAQRRFYTDLWHALQGRRMINDVNGAYPDNTGETFQIGQLPLDPEGRPRFNHYNSDSFWGAQWTINTLWGLVYPEIMAEFSKSMLQYYHDGGLVPRGPSGGNYTYVMTGASSTPFVVSAIQKGLLKDSLETVYEALKKNHMPGGIMGKAGYEHNTTIGGGLTYYIEKGYVPFPLPDGKYGLHQDGSGQTLEYAYQDWTLAQLAKKLGHTEDYDYFMARSKNYTHVFDKNVGWMAPKNEAGAWSDDFDPYAYESGFVESNAAQSTWFVPHDLMGLAALMGGPEKAVEKLEVQFESAEKLGFTSGDSHDAELHPEYRRIPINYGNQPSMQTAFVFHKLGRPDRTQYWSRKVVETVFSGLSPETGYNGDEDQGLMGSLAVLLKIGLFQMNGGTGADPEYLIGSPIFDRVTIALNPEYYSGGTFIIESTQNGEGGVFVKDIQWNGKAMDGYSISHSTISNGGTLQLEMTDRSNNNP
ncbi:GH92 family glycosyl hydrolase [Pareuzebyella sediminis]|uniref:GH92 family glycosyl hydrolase n=1 Tax=Pareuzebyella sediminis TaxID=2607998 RepID=UPI0011EC7CF2|nr:GH92 family glycosyl hydrolase [Pareuzebyella sediminis]